MLYTRLPIADLHAVLMRCRPRESARHRLDDRIDHPRCRRR